MRGLRNILIIALFSLNGCGYITYYATEHLKYNLSLRMHYTVDTLEDKQIIFYNKELIHYAKKFLYAKGLYEVFEMDVKKDLALDCIEASLSDYYQEDLLEEGRNFRKNARNLPLRTEALIEKYKAQEQYLSSHSYYYSSGTVYEILSTFSSTRDKERNKNTCNKLVPIALIYKEFIDKYIANREELLSNQKKQLLSPRHGMSEVQKIKDKIYTKKRIKQLKEWLKILYTHTSTSPKEIRTSIKKSKESAKKKKRQEELVSIKKGQKKEKKRQKKLRQLKSILYKKNKDLKEIDRLLKESISPNLYAVANLKGQPLLYEALRRKDIQALKILLDYGVYPLGNEKKDAIIFSNTTNKESFNLILASVLKKADTRHASLHLFNAVYYHASLEKIELILEYVLKNEIDKYMYDDVLKVALENCVSTQTIRLLLKDKHFDKNKALYSRIKKSSYRCKNQKEIEALFEEKRKRVKL